MSGGVESARTQVISRLLAGALFSGTISNVQKHEERIAPTKNFFIRMLIGLVPNVEAFFFGQRLFRRVR